VLGADGTVIYQSPSVERVLGYRPEERIGLNIFVDVITHPDDMEAKRRFLADALARPGEPVAGGWRLAHKDGSWRDIEAVGVNLLGDPAVGGIVATYRDATERRRAEEERRRLVAMVAHELRTPLTTIAGYAALMERRERYDAKALAIIREQARRLERLTLDLRDSVRAEAGVLSLHRAATEPSVLIAGTVEQVRIATGRAIAADIARDLPTANWDADRVAQVLGNLLLNAVQHTPPAGAVSVRAEDAGVAVRMVVADTGAGIPPEALPRIFEPFYRAGESGADAARGMGLGLPITKALVERHGGTIAVASAVGEGTTFTITLPYGAAAT
jgi:PAS domain S-box-containing protein